MRVVEDKLAADVAEELGVIRTVVHNATSRIRRRINEQFGAILEVE
jgi:DNA-directed RNA polymerase specialized sigma24 family protein